MKISRRAITLAVVFLFLLAAAACESAPDTPVPAEVTPVEPLAPATASSSPSSASTSVPPTPLGLAASLTATPPTVAPPTLAPPVGPPAYSAVTFSADFDEQTQLAIHPGKRFPYGSRAVFASWSYTNVVPGTLFEYEWYRNGATVWTAREQASRLQARSFQALGYIHTPAMPLDAGEYRFLARVGTRTIVSDTFVIPSAPITGTNVLTVFFTVQNGTPTGYVLDKQAIKHVPAADRSISDFYVSIGDRIVIQTDQPGFSLLLDCGDALPVFTPCDFSAESPAQLPTALRKNRNGTATLNISRARNWGTARPEFEPQRYPAEPVLRVVFGD